MENAHAEHSVDEQIHCNFHNLGFNLEAEDSNLMIHSDPRHQHMNQRDSH